MTNQKTETYSCIQTQTQYKYHIIIETNELLHMYAAKYITQKHSLVNGHVLHKIVLAWVFFCRSETESLSINGAVLLLDSWTASQPTTRIKVLLADADTKQRHQLHPSWFTNRQPRKGVVEFRHCQLSIYNNRIVKMCNHGRGLDGRTVARGRWWQAQVASGTSKAGQMKGRADGQADGPNRT